MNRRSFFRLLPAAPAAAVVVVIPPEYAADHAFLTDSAGANPMAMMRDTAIRHLRTASAYWDEGAL